MKSTVAKRVQRHRDHLRAAGLRPIQLWVPDTRKRGFKSECKRQSLLLVGDKHEKEVLGWLEVVADTEDWK